LNPSSIKKFTPMLEKKLYANGQPVYKLADGMLIFYYKNGTVKAEGPYPDNMMEGEWRFYRESGQLWQIGNFKNNQKHGSWIRYDRNNNVEYQETFEHNKAVNPKRR